MILPGASLSKSKVALGTKVAQELHGSEHNSEGNKGPSDDNWFFQSREKPYLEINASWRSTHGCVDGVDSRALASSTTGWCFMKMDCWKRWSPTDKEKQEYLCIQVC